MSDPTAIGFGLKEIVVSILGMFLTVLGIRHEKTLNKVDEHEKNHVSRHELNETVKAIRDDIKDANKYNAESHKELRTGVTGIHNRIDKLVDKR